MSLPFSEVLQACFDRTIELPSKFPSFCLYFFFFADFFLFAFRFTYIKTRCSPRNDGNDENFDACPSYDSSLNYCCACR